MSTVENKIALLDITKIVPNHRQKAQFVDTAKVAEIKASLLENRNNGTKGLLQVPTARPLPDGSFEQAFGRHRLIAFQELAQEDNFFATMPTIVREMNDQEMFEAMLVENLARREISIFEEAALFQDYMSTFGLNSVQAAPRLNRTEEYIRSRIMLLQLPDAAREGEKKGIVNVTVARDLVTVNKLLGAEGVEEALKEIDEIDGDRFSIYDSPQEVIDALLCESKKLMRLDPQAGWFSAKKFPTQYLDRLTDNAVTKAMGITLKGATPQLRADLKKLIDCVSAGKDFADADFPSFARDELQKVHVLVNPPSCDSCSMHASFDGHHYCPFRPCHDRKGGAWERKELDDKSKKIGIALYKKEDGQTAELNPRDDADCKLVKSKHTDLRLMKAQYIWGNFENVGPNLRVVAVGKTAERRLGAKQEEVQKADNDQLLRQREMQKKEIKKQFTVRFQWDVASNAFVSALDGVTSFDLMAFMLDEMMDYNLNADYPGDLEGPELLDDARQAKKVEGLRMARRLIMHEALDKRLSNEWREHVQSKGSLWDQKQPVIALAKLYTSFADQWGVKLGKTFMSQAEKYQAELDAALKEINKAPKKVTEE